MNREAFQRLVAFLVRHLFCTICTVVTLGAIGVAVYFLQDVADLQAEYDARNREGETMLATRKLGPTLRQELASVRDAVRSIEANLIDKDNLSDNYAYFQGLERNSRAKLEDAQQYSPSAGVATIYRTVPFTLRVSGTYAQVHAYLHAVETGPRLTNITSFSLRRLPQPEGQISLQLSLDLLGKP